MIDKLEAVMEALHQDIAKLSKEIDHWNEDEDRAMDGSVWKKWERRDFLKGRYSFCVELKMLHEYAMQKGIV